MEEMEISETYERSETIGELATALAVSQGKMQPAKKSSYNPFTKRNYADLSAVWDAVREPLSNNGLSVMQMPGKIENGRVSITTVLIHKTGEYIQSTIFMPTGKGDAQSIGSAITYGRRYALAAMVGVSLEDDDAEMATDHGGNDMGNSAKNNQALHKTQNKPKQSGKPSQKIITVSELGKVLSDKKIAINDFSRLVYNKKPDELNQVEIDNAFYRLEAAIAEYTKRKDSEKEEIPMS